METAARIAVSLLGSVVVFQILLAFGAPWGRAAWGGRHPGVLPTHLRIASGLSAFVVYPQLMDAIVAAAGLRDHPLAWTPGATGMWVLAGLFAVIARGL